MMMKIMWKKTAAALLCLMILGVFAGCDDPAAADPDTEPEETITAVTGVTLNTTSLQLIAGGETATLTATVLPSTAVDKTVSWSVTNANPSDCLTISNGIVTPLLTGSATVIVTTVDGSKTASCLVTVNAQSSGGEEPVEPTTIRIFNPSAYVPVVLSASTPYDNCTLTASPDRTVEIKASSAVNGSNTFTKCAALGGSGSTTYRSIRFTLPADSTLYVYALSSSTTTDRTLNLTPDGTTILTTFTAPGAYSLGSDTVPELTYVYTGSEQTVYLYSASSGINIYSIKVVTGQSTETVYPSSVSLSSVTLSLEAGNSSVLTATVLPSTAANKTVTWSVMNADPSDCLTISNGTVTAVKAGTASVTATTINGKTASCSVTVTAASSGGESGTDPISIDDIPSGWAGYTGTADLAGGAVTKPANYGGKGASASYIFTVSTRAALKSAISYGTAGSPRIIYINGMIDMTDEGTGSKLPSVYNGTSAALDAFITSQTSGTAHAVTSYSAWKTTYGANVVSTADQSGTIATVQSKLKNAWGSLITLTIPSNTTIIGLSGNSGIRGGCIKIYNVSNVVIRNLQIMDAYDPFPKMEANDGLNAEWDGVVIQGSKYVWIDHCTLGDTYEQLDYVTTGNGISTKWQTYDGLCDIKSSSSTVLADFITVSWCKFVNHDKTMLLGSSDSYTYELNHQTITLHHNWYDDCISRLPMVRFATIHIFNNYYSNVGSYAIGARLQSRVYSEGNYFESSSTSVGDSTGTLYDVGSYNIKTSSVDGSTAWTPSTYYSYGADTAADAKTKVMASAGAGKVTVNQ